MDVPSQPVSTEDVRYKIAALAQHGSPLFDPVRLHYLETVDRQLANTSGATRLILERKLTDALADYQNRFANAKLEATADVAYVALRYPNSAVDVQRLFESGDFQGVRLLKIRLKQSTDDRPFTTLVHCLQRGDSTSELRTLDDLLREQESDTAVFNPNELTNTDFVSSPRPPELRSLQFFRDIVAKFSADKRVTQAIEAPLENAGPLNSHKLVIRSLCTMRDISPDYLSRFVSYADTLLWLEQSGKKMQGAIEKVPINKVKTKSRRKKIT